MAVLNVAQATPTGEVRPFTRSWRTTLQELDDATEAQLKETLGGGVVLPAAFRRRSPALERRRPTRRSIFVPTAATSPSTARATWTMRDVRCAMAGALVMAMALSVCTQMPVAVVAGGALLTALVPVLWLAMELAHRSHPGGGVR